MINHWKVIALALTLALVTLSAGCKRKPQAQIVLKDAAVSAWDDSVNVGAQLQLANDGDGAARQLRVTKVEVTGGNYTGPASLPTGSLGDLAAGADLMFDAVLNLPATTGTPRQLALEGSYLERRRFLLFFEKDRQQYFRVERSISPSAVPPGPVVSVPGQVSKQNPNTAVYPPAPPPAPFGPNAETPMFVPIGPIRQLFAPTPTGTALGTTGGAAPVQIPRNTSMRSAGTPPDP